MAHRHDRRVLRTAGTRSWEESMSRVILTLAAFVAVLLGPASVAAAAEGSAGAGYTPPNTPAQPVLVFQTFAGSGAAQIQFSPSGRALVVSEKTTSTLDVFIVGKDGAAGPATSYASSGTTPFGFAFGRHEDLVVSEAAGAAPLSAASSYELSKDGTLRAISRSIPTTQAAACWVAVTKDGRYAFTANAASDSISTFSVDNDGALTLVFAQAAHSTGAHTTDMALTENSSYLYANDGGTHMISAFRVGADGSLTRLPGVTIPVGASGLAAR